ncbi:hypothetical protein [Burkholderia anthina]|nr:hypothetical protein [Burkholderia anthina]
MTKKAPENSGAGRHRQVKAAAARAARMTGGMSKRHGLTNAKRRACPHA